MAYNEYLADRVRSSLRRNHIHFNEKKMFGGICFFVDDKMFAGVMKEELMVRVDPQKQEEYLLEDYCRPLDFTKSRMKGFLYIAPEGIDMEEDLDKWTSRCLEYNPRAWSAKNKKR
ncbi:MAG: TfoX/Sxy family protein [Prolixibacteraceae bacterium]|nr:TfoX/Sxy family protein [Prolixibacteraceae bacterium]